MILLWNQCLKYLERELSSRDFNTWIRPLQALEEAGKLCLLAPNKFVLEWVKQHYYERISTILTHLSSGQGITLVLQIGNRSQQNGYSINEPRQPLAIVPPTHRLNPRLTFANFVVGHSNHLAHTASLQVATQNTYNPLFIYGGVGLGKTHLMQAVGNQIFVNKQTTKIAYLHSERFVNEWVKALREKTVSEFKRYYRSVDALLVDDVQFFAHKTQSQEELFHTINSLLDEQKQIVLTCNRIPQNLEGVEDRLRSRFSWGLTVSIEPPELETRIAILQAKAHAAQVSLPYEVAHFVATHIPSNVRELEGALHRLLAMAQLLRQPISLASAQETLEDLLTTPPPLLSLNTIQRTVADYFKVPLEELCSSKRQRRLARPRQIAMYLSRELTQYSLPEIGQAFGGRDHTTVIYSCKTIAKLKATDQQVNEDYTYLLKRLSSQCVDSKS